MPGASISGRVPEHGGGLGGWRIAPSPRPPIRKWPRGRAMALLDVEQLDLEDEGCVGWDHAAGTARAVAKLRWDGELADTANLHSLNALVPALDDPAATQRERERLPAIL